MSFHRHIDRLLQRLKEWEARYYYADYARLREEHRWLTGDKKKVRTLPVVPHNELRSLLIYKPDEIGDAVYSLPAIQRLRQALPQARLSLICQKKTAPLFERTGLLDEIATVSVKTYFRKFPSLSVAEALKKLTAKEFDAGIFLRSYPGYFRQFKRLPCRLLIHPRDPRMRSRSPVQPFVSLWVGDRAHQAVQLLEIVEPLTQYHPQLSEVQFPSLQFTEADRSVLSQVFGSRRPTSYLVVHPFADFETRHYVYWGEILRWLRDRFRVPVVTIGGPQDPTLKLPSEILQTQGKLTLGQTAYLISQSKVFLGNLSGPVHLAGAMQVPTVTMMSGHSAPAEWTPFSDALVIRAEVGCAPCHLRSCTQYQLACVRSLNPLKVLPHLEAFISSRMESSAPRKGLPTEILL